MPVAAQVAAVRIAQRVPDEDGHVGLGHPGREEFVHHERDRDLAVRRRLDAALHLVGETR